MKKQRIAIIATTALTFTIMAGCNGCKNNKNQPDGVADTLDTVSTEMPKDSTQYATLGEGTGMECVELITEKGDTLSLIKEDEKTGEPAKIMGDIEYDKKYAFTMGADSTTLLTLLNLSQLCNAWTQPIPGQNGQQGIDLKADKKAESINMSTLTYKNWALYNGRLVLNSVSQGNGQSFEASDTVNIDLLTDDSLKLHYGDRVECYARKK